MAITFTATRSIPKSTKVRVRIVTTDAVEAGVAAFRTANSLVGRLSGKPGDTHVHPDGKRTEVLIGIGDAADVDTDAVPGAAPQSAAGSVATASSVSSCPRPNSTVRLAPSAGRGIALSTTFTTYKSDAKPRSLRPSRSPVALVRRTRRRSTVVLHRPGPMLARDFVNEPGGVLTPACFARRAQAVAKEGLAVKVWDEAAIKKGKLGGLLGVNRGSTQPPRFVELTYTPKSKPKGTLALIGKGITFDAGGLSIKTGAGMMTMKCDMGGAAAVIGAMSVLKDLGVGCRVRAFVPMTDNMLGGDATRPGDVLKIRNGKTIEVLNTDAEGRLILADALSLASEAKPDAMIDLATLTGACMVALGPKIAGLMGNNDSWIEQIEAASDLTGERVWHLPLPADYRKQVESSVADMKNIGGPHGGALTAGLILQEFVADEIPWAHLDIAGPAFTDSDDAEITKGGTGFGVRLLAELAQLHRPVGAGRPQGPPGDRERRRSAC